MKANKAVYICGGFEKSQYLWSLIIIDAYCKKQKITKLILENKLPEEILSVDLIDTLLSNYKIIYASDLDPGWLKNKFLRMICLFLTNLRHSLVINNKYLLHNKNFRNSQIGHGIWDLSLLNSKKDNLKPSKLDKYKASLLVMTKYFRTSNICKKFSVDAFLGHSVYQDRATLTCLRENKSNIFSQANYSFHKQPLDDDTAWNLPDFKLMRSIKKLIKPEEVENYWELRLQGKGNYEDANRAIKNLALNNKYFYFKNVIMLHVFKDSPFNKIDKSRIFADYIEWISETIKIIKNSNENWLIKFHPSAKQWGEDQNLIIKKLLGRNCKNIHVDDGKLSNIEIFRKIKRLVTYSGTSHLESAIFGIKPIVISDVISSKFLENSVLKPVDLDNYRDLLLEDSSSKLFEIKEEYKYPLKELLYIQENILSFKSSIGADQIYRGTSPEDLTKNFQKISINLEKNSIFLSKLGSKLSDGLTHTVSDLMIDSI